MRASNLGKGKFQHWQQLPKLLPTKLVGTFKLFLFYWPISLWSPFTPSALVDSTFLTIEFISCPQTCPHDLNQCYHILSSIDVTPNCFLILKFFILSFILTTHIHLAQNSIIRIKNDGKTKDGQAWQ